MPTARAISAIPPSSTRRSQHLMAKDYAAKQRASIDLDHATAADRRALGGAAARRQQHHALLGRRQPRQRGQQHLYAEFPLWRRPGGGRHRRAAQQRARRFHRRARRVQRLRPGRLRGQSARPRQTAAVVDVADHRAEGRQAGAGDGLARRQPHHLDGAAGDRQRARLSTWTSRPRSRRRGCTINGCRTRCGSSAASPTRRSQALKAKGHQIVRTARPDLGQFDRGDREWIARRARSAHPWRGGGGAVDLSLTADRAISPMTASRIGVGFASIRAQAGRRGQRQGRRRRISGGTCP